MTSASCLLIISDERFFDYERSEKFHVSFIAGIAEGLHRRLEL